MNRAYRIVIFFIIGFIILFIIGSALRDLVDTEACDAADCVCYNIKSCESCWRNTTLQITSELCPNPNISSNVSCTALPSQMQHNAVVDLLLCACTEAEENGYKDSERIIGIRELVRNVFGYDLSAEEVCEDPARFLTKVSYG